MSARLSVAARRLGYRAAHTGLRAWWLVRRPHTRAVKCIVRDAEGRIVFVRHTYGPRRNWEIPGGGLHRGEEPQAAVRREMREELGIELEGLRAIGRVEVSGSHKRTEITCFAAEVAGGAALRADPGEVAEVRWAPPEDPPRPLGRDAAALLRLAAGAGR